MHCVWNLRGRLVDASDQDAATFSMQCVLTLTRLSLKHMAQHFERHVRRLLHWCHSPRPLTRISSTCRQGIRPLHSRAIHSFARRHQPCSGLFIFRRCEQEHRERYHPIHPSALVPSHTGATGYPSVATHAAIRSCILCHAAGHVLQRIYHYLYLHRGVSRILRLRMGVIQRVAGR